MEESGTESRFGIIKTIRFGLASIAGFAVTEAFLTIGPLVLYGKVAIPQGSYSSPSFIVLDVLSFIGGTSASFLVNERITVKRPEYQTGKDGSRLRSFFEFQAVCGVGNVCVIAIQLGLLAALSTPPSLGTAVGSIATYPIVYFISIRYVWKSYQVR
ncbi:MAG: GtrA family protein [Thaumarchaeota archaeon]|nr:GtrA family protein [Nitrososphaerota archaeon]